MRISTNQFYQTGLNNILDQQLNLSITQDKISSGLKVTKPSDDPVAAITIINLEQEIALTERYNKNIDIATANLTTEETVMQQLTDIMQRIRELILSAGNATYGNVERGSLAEEMDGILDQVVGLANFKNTSGDYLFAGHKNNLTPFTQDAAGNYTYNGDQGVRNIQVSTSTQIAANDSGYSVFQNILNGNGDFITGANSGNTGRGVIDTGDVVDPGAYVPDSYDINIVDLGGGTLGYDVIDSGGGTVVSGAPFVEGGDITFNGINVTVTGAPEIGDNFTVAPSSRQDVFSTIRDTVTALRTNVLDEAGLARLNTQLKSSLDNVDQVMQNFGIIQADVGTRLNVLQSQSLINSDFVLSSKVTLSKVRDLDIAEAITDLNIRQISLEAAQASFVRIQNLSLFNFL